MKWRDSAHARAINVMLHTAGLSYLTHKQVDAVLEALDSARLLLPEGGEERTEEGVEVHGELVAVVVGRSSHRRVVRAFPDGSSYVGPWSEVTE